MNKYKVQLLGLDPVDVTAADVVIVSPGSVQFMDAYHRVSHIFFGVQSVVLTGKVEPLSETILSALPREIDPLEENPPKIG